MAEQFYTEHGLLLSDHTLVEFAEGCTDAGSSVPGRHEIGEQVPCPHCPDEHRIAEALVVPVAHNIEITETEAEDQPDHEIGD